MQLTVSLSPDRVQDFATLVAEIVGHGPNSMPWLYPALLFSDSAVQARLGMPVPEASEILVHDYQAITQMAPLPIAKPIAARALRTVKGATTEFDFALGDVDTPEVTLKTALRIVPRQDLANLKPSRFADAKALGDVGFVPDFRISQAQIDRYVVLSGDGNPIHSDPAEAHALGLHAPIVPGLLLLSVLQPVVANARPGAVLDSLKCRFIAPLCAGDSFAIAVQARGGNRLRGYFLADAERALAIADLRIN